MKPTTLHTLLFTILFSAVSIFSANAQLTYSGGRLSLDIDNRAARCHGLCTRDKNKHSDIF